MIVNKNLTIPLMACVAACTTLHSAPPADETISFNGKNLELRHHHIGQPQSIPIVFLAEGYTELEKDNFLAKVDALVAGLIQEDIFDEFSDHFAVSSIFVASNDSGIDDYRQNPPILRDTFFDGNIPVDTILYSDTELARDCLFEFGIFHTYKIPVTILNFPTGRANAPTTLSGESAINIHRQNATRTLAHELGHAIARLADEYVDESIFSLSPGGVNTQPFSEAKILAGIQPEDVRWSHWLTPGIALPTLRDPQSVLCSSNNTGLYEGASYEPTNWFRPQCKCMMRSSHTTPDFCVVCKEHMVYNLIRKAVAIESESLSQPPLILDPGAVTSFTYESSVLSHPNTIDGLIYRWSINDKVVSESNQPHPITVERPIYGWVSTTVRLEVYPDGYNHNDYIRSPDLLAASLYQRAWSIGDVKWWYGYGGDYYTIVSPLTSNLKNEDGPATLGQLKHLAFTARRHLQAPFNADGLLLSETLNLALPGPEIDSLVNDFLTPASKNNPANYSPITLGQLKAVAKPFYDRLHALGYDTRAMLIARGYPASWPHIYPWDPNTPVSVNYQIATAGQMKLAFSFEAHGRFLSP